MVGAPHAPKNGRAGQWGFESAPGYPQSHSCFHSIPPGTGGAKSCNNTARKIKPTAVAATYQNVGGNRARPVLLLGKTKTLLASNIAHPAKRTPMTRIVGMSPAKYQLNARMNEARRRLRETKQSIVGIAMDLGYSNPSHFAQVFRRESRMPPSEYRRQR